MPGELPGPSYPRRRWTMPRGRIIEALAALTSQGFVSGWREDHGWWWVDFPGADHWYSRSQIVGFIDGCDAMGAATYVE